VTLLHKIFQQENNRKTSNQSSLTLVIVAVLVVLSSFSQSVKALVTEQIPGSHWHVEEWFQDSISAQKACMEFAVLHGYPGACHGFGSRSRQGWEAGWLRNPPTSGKFYLGDFYYKACQADEYLDRDYGCKKITLEKDHKQSQEICTGNPINVATGNKFQTETDHQSQTPFGLSFVRFYNSSSNAVDKGVGKKWRHGFNRSLKLVDTQAQVARSNGQTFLFNLTDGNWVGDVDIPDTLVELTDEAGVRTDWQYQDSNDTVELFNASGQLLSITNRAGQTQTFVYDLAVVDGGDDNSNTLDKVVSFGGEEMLFSYDSSNRISSMTDPEGNSYRYSYDDAGNLTSVVYPDDTPLDDLDNPTRTYHYENTSFPSHLTGLTDETGSRVTWAFDEEGRAISSELDGGVDKSTLDFSIDDQVTVTNPLGKDTTYHFETLHGVKKVVQVEGHATESCAGANQNYTYDTNGYIESKTDWQGNVTTYVHNERGLETSRTEASGTDEARTITTQWHDDFRLPVKVTSPGQVTGFVYDDKGRLLSQTTFDVQP